jgi:hypothetical protein
MPVNIKIINDLKSFITHAATQAGLRELFTKVKNSHNPFIMRCPLKFIYEIRDFVTSNSNDTIIAFRATKYSSDELCKHGFVVPIGSTNNVRLIEVILDDGTTGYWQPICLEKRITHKKFLKSCILCDRELKLTIM